MRRFREVLRAAVASRLAAGPVALLFSGGTDSLTVLWTLLDLGADVRCYAFRLEERESADARAAALAARTWAVPLQAVTIPRQAPAELAADVRRLVRRIGSARKTHVECAWPFSWVAPRVPEAQVWCGLCADDLWGSARSAAVRYGDDPAGFREHRRRLAADPSSSAWAQITGLFADQGKELASPYRDPGVVDYLVGFSWRELNRPRQKMPALAAFAQEFGQAPLWRRNDNLQCGSGVRERLAALLACPEVNRLGRRRAADLYRDFLEGRA